MIFFLVRRFIAKSKVEPPTAADLRTVIDSLVSLLQSNTAGQDTSPQLQALTFAFQKYGHRVLDLASAMRSVQSGWADCHPKNARRIRRRFGRKPLHMRRFGPKWSLLKLWRLEAFSEYLISNLSSSSFPLDSSKTTWITKQDENMCKLLAIMIYCVAVSNNPTRKVSYQFNAAAASFPSNSVPIDPPAYSLTDNVQVSATEIQSKNKQDALASVPQNLVEIPLCDSKSFNTLLSHLCCRKSLKYHYLPEGNDNNLLWSYLSDLNRNFSEFDKNWMFGTKDSHFTECCMTFLACYELLLLQVHMKRTEMEKRNARWEFGDAGAMIFFHKVKKQKLNHSPLRTQHHKCTHAEVNDDMVSNSVENWVI